MQMSSSATGKVVVGLGKTGLSCARFLRFAGEEFSVVDSRLNPPGLQEFYAEFPDVTLQLGPFQASTLEAASELVLSPGISLQEPAVAAAIAKGVNYCGDIDIFSRNTNKPIVAVTGSNGKSTVVSLVGEMARNAGLDVAVGGNLDGRSALPALDMLRQSPKQLYVLELSSFQLETTRSLNAEAAVILNITEDHMDRYASMQDYANAKQRIFHGCKQVVVNRDDAASAPGKPHNMKVWYYGMDRPDPDSFGVLCDSTDDYLAFGNEQLLPVSAMKLVGRHNVSNALAALTLGHAVGLSHESMTTTLREFSGLPHRCQWVRNLDDIDYYNDSKGTNPGATVVAIQSIGEMVSGAIVLIAGGVGKDADFTPMHAVVLQYVSALILIGRDANQLAAVLEGATQIFYAADMTDAVAQARNNAKPRDAVLLSPACASFDMFNDFGHRGAVFMAAVEALQ